LELKVEGEPPGCTLSLPASGGRVEVTWRVESVSLQPERLEILVGGVVADQVALRAKEGEMPLKRSGTLEIQVNSSTWIALRAYGSYRGRAGDIAAHTSAVFIQVGDEPLFVEQDARDIQQQIEGAIRYVETIAPVSHSAKYEHLRATLQRAHAQLHSRFAPHAQGI